MTDRTVYEFGDFRLDPELRQLVRRRSGSLVEVSATPFNALLYFVDNAGKAISRDTLIETLWQGRVVEDNNLNQVVAALRRIVGKSTVSTLPGHGYQFTAEVRRILASQMADPPKASTAQALGRRLGVAGGVTVAVLISWATLSIYGSLEESSSLNPDGIVVSDTRLAVLPFRDISPESNWGHLAEGMASELINTLSRIEGLSVTGRASSFLFQSGQNNANSIAESLNVRYLLEGDIQATEDTLRISVALSDGANGIQLWSDSYEATPDDYFSIQDEIADSVAQAMQIKLAVGETGTRLGMTRDVHAFDEYLKAMEVDAFGQVTLEDFRRSVLQLERAVALDPAFSLAWLALAERYRVSAVRVDGGLPGSQTRAVDALKQVRRLTPELPELFLFDSESAIRSSEHYVDLELRLDRYLEAAVQQEVSLIERARYQVIFLVGVGRIREAIPMLERAFALDPLSIRIAPNLSHAYAIDGDYASAFGVIDQVSEVAELDGVQAENRLLIALGSRDLAEIRKSLAWFADAPANAAPINSRIGALLFEPEVALREIRSEFYATQELPPLPATVSLTSIAAWAAYFGDDQLALDALQQFSDVAHGNLRDYLSIVLSQPVYAPARQLPGFKSVVEELGLAVYWQQTGNWSDYCRPIEADDYECF